MKKPAKRGLFCASSYPSAPGSPMCYSALLLRDFRSLQRRYGGQLDFAQFVEMVRQRERGFEFDFDMKTPDELIAGLIDMGGTAAKEIELIQRRWKVAERRRLELALSDAQGELQVALDKSAVKVTKTAHTAVDTKGRKITRAQKSLESSSIVAADVCDRINQEHGRDTVRLAASGVARQWRMRAENRSPRYTTCWSELPAVNKSIIPACAFFRARENFDDSMPR